MKALKKFEIRLAYAMPIAAAVSFVGFLGFAIEIYSSTKIHSRIVALVLTFLFTVIAPVLGYCVLGVVGYLAAKRNSSILVGLLWLLLFPACYLSALLFIIVQFSYGLYSLLLYGPAPLVSLVAALTSTASRIEEKRSERHLYPPI